MLLEVPYVDFLITHKLTQAQFLLLQLIYKGRQDLIIRYKKAFPNEDDDTMIGEIWTNDLFERGYLISNNGVVSIGEKFLEIFIDKHSATEEVFRVFPSFFEKDGVTIPLTAMDRNVFATVYDKAIQSSTEEHLEVIKDIEFGVKEKLLNMGIDKFVKSRYWLQLREKRLAHVINHSVKLRSSHEF